MKKMMNTKMMKTLRKKVPPLLLAALMLLGTAVTVTPRAEAYMYPCSNPASMNIKTYPQDANTRSIPAYGSSSLSGTKVGTVYGTDLITILKAEGDALYVRFPAGSRDKEGWIKASYVSPANLNGSHSLAMRAGGKIPVYRYETGSATIGSISRNDTVYLCYAGLDHESGRAQFIYPVSGGWKMGWCSFADIGNNWFRACGGSQTINDGIYFVNVSPTHRMDGMGPNENVHVWEKLNVDQQKVRITHQGGGIYHIQFLHNGTYLDQQYATQDSSTLLAHGGNGGTNQDWYIADLGNGRYGFFNACSGLSLDVYCYRTQSNGADILAYPYNGQAVTLEKLDGGPIARTSSIKPQQGALTISQVIKTTVTTNDSNANVSVTNRAKENGIRVSNKEGNRSAANYNAVIDQYAVTSNSRYQRTSTATWCNIFAWDVTRALGCEIPHWTKNNAPVVSFTSGAGEMTANRTYNWLRDYGSTYGWKKVSDAEAQRRANAGYPTVAVWYNSTGKSGHIAIVRPEGSGFTYSSSRGPVIAQAGASNYNYTNVRTGFGRTSGVVYYTHN